VVIGLFIFETVKKSMIFCQIGQIFHVDGSLLNTPEIFHGRLLA
jgi:hypothetical protein